MFAVLNILSDSLNFVLFIGSKIEWSLKSNLIKKGLK